MQLDTSWIEIVLDVDRRHAESLSDALLEAGALSVSVEDADQGTTEEQPLFGEPGIEPAQAAWDRSRIIALTAADSDHVAIAAAAIRASGLEYDADKPPYAVRQVPMQDWVQLTQSQFEPIQIGQRIWVVPSWHQAPDPQAVVLQLDPGLAFGTGTHPTTRLCMEWLEANVAPDKSVLDYGCGSGILAVLAQKLGAVQVVGVDIDPQAIEAARRNSAANRCNIEVYLPEQFAAMAPPARFDIVLANILAGPLTLMARLLTDRVAPGGTLVLSGILRRQAKHVMAAYAPQIEMTIHAESDGWIALTGRRCESA